MCICTVLCQDALQLLEYHQGFVTQKVFLKMLQVDLFMNNVCVEFSQMKGELFFPLTNVTERSTNAF